jgi:exonuclease III
MVLGDFNCIISDLDTKSGNMVTSNNLKLILENIIDTLNVVDTLRYKYPNRKSYTFTLYPLQKIIALTGLRYIFSFVF